jgi:hypothetical protein
MGIARVLYPVPQHIQLGLNFRLSIRVSRCLSLGLLLSKSSRPVHVLGGTIAASVFMTLEIINDASGPLKAKVHALVHSRGGIKQPSRLFRRPVRLVLLQSFPQVCSVRLPEPEPEPIKEASGIFLERFREEEGL